MTQAICNIATNSKQSLSRRAALTGAVAVAVSAPAAVGLPAATPADHAAILARAEEIIYRLRTRHIREGWSPDTEGGERMLRYFRRCVANPGYDDPDEFYSAVVEYTGRNNQSLDWLLSGNPGEIGRAHV